MHFEGEETVRQAPRREVRKLADLYAEQALAERGHGVHGKSSGQSDVLVNCYQGCVLTSTGSNQAILLQGISQHGGSSFERRISLIP